MLVAPGFNPGNKMSNKIRRLHDPGLKKELCRRRTIKRRLEWKT